MLDDGILMGFVLRNTLEAMREHRINLESKSLLYLYYEDDLRILYERVGKMNEFLEVLQV